MSTGAVKWVTELLVRSGIDMFFEGVMPIVFAVLMLVYVCDFVRLSGHLRRARDLNERVRIVLQRKLIWDVLFIAILAMVTGLWIGALVLR